MEGSEGEAAFDAFNLNPQLFLNEVVNAVDDIVDGAFDFYIQQAPQVIGGGSEQSEELARGILSLRHMTQAVLNKRMSMWEKYSLRNCFSVPDGFSLPNSEESSISMLQEISLTDNELDSQLVSLREKLTAAGSKSKELQREIGLLEKQSTVKNNCHASLAEAKLLFEEHSAHHMFQELAESTFKLNQRVAELKRSKDLRQQESLEKVQNLSRENKMNPDRGLSAEVADIQEMVSILRHT